MIGQTISHYRILEKLGEGGAGVVYRARDLDLERTVALKFLKTRMVADEQRAERFRQEARAVAAVDHPNICTVYEIGEADGQIFIAMAYVDGSSLLERLQSGPLPPELASTVAEKIARGLGAAHAAGLVHRDIKSGNVMLTPAGDVKIMDFGLARGIEPDALETQTLTAGTPAYMSPEQLRGEVLDRRTDLWSWGVVLYEMLVGRLPFWAGHLAGLIHAILTVDPEPPSRANPAVPPRLDRVVARALAKRRQHRYGSAVELLAELLDPGGGSAVPPPRAERPLAIAAPSIAVLSFADMSPDHDQGFFCDGIAEEIINDLTHIEGLRVASRTSSFAYRDRNADIREIGRALGVDTVLEGSVRKDGDRVRVTSQLIDVADGYHLWSERYDRRMEDVLAIQEEIAHSVTRALQVTLTEREQRALRKTVPEDPRAYELYLEGRQTFYRSRRDAIERAVELFREATAIAPGFAPAYAGLADCHAYLFMYFGGQSEHLAEADRASRQALDLSPERAEAHAARGLALSLDERYAEAARQFEAAIRLNPRSFEAYYFYARICFAQGKLEQAADLYRHATEIDPSDYQAPSLLGFTLRALNDPAAAERYYRVSIERAERHLEAVPDSSRAWYLGAQALLSVGERKRALEWIDRAYEAAPGDPYNLYGLACFYAQAGEVERGARFFEQSVAAGFAHRAWAERDIDLDPLRGHPRFRAALSTMAPAGRASGSGAPVVPPEAPS